MNLLDQFKEYLFSQSNGASRVTVKNYLSDINHFIRWFEQSYNIAFSPKEITHKTIEAYKVQNSDVFSASSLERHFSSLRKFFTFLRLEGQISIDPFQPLISNAGQSENDPWKIKDFKNYLYVYNASHLTIKNYLIDIKQFLNWAEEVSGLNVKNNSLNNVLNYIDSDLIEEYKQRLVSYGNFSPATINRKLSSLRRYLTWATEQNLIKPFGFTTNIADKKAQLNLPSKAEVVLPIVEAKRTYSKFPPLRLAQKVAQLFVFAMDTSLIIPLAKFVNNAEYVLWKSKGKSIFEKAKNISIPRVISHADILGIKNLPKELYAPLEISTRNFPWYKKTWFKLRYTRPQWYKVYHSYPVVHYFHFAVLIIFLAAISFGFYNAFFQKGNQTPTLAVGTPTAPPRILSFQGRLTDNLDNPISTPSALRFAIYTDATASDSGTTIMPWQEIDFVTPDQDGIFNVILGNNTTIPSTLFAQNSALWLGVTVGRTAELTPRQPLATVAFATNAEFLQGLAPITDTRNGTLINNAVLALDSSGNLTIGDGVTAASPTFQAVGGTFKLSGQPLLLTTNAGTNGNVTITPDGLGRIDLQKPLQNSTNNNNINTAAGAVEVDDLFAILATSSGQSALTINQNSTGPLISASTSGVAKFTVDSSGNMSAAGNGNISGNLIAGGTTTFGGKTYTWPGSITAGNYVLQTQTDGTLAWVAQTGGGFNFWQELTGALSPTHTGDDLLLGASSTTSADFAFTGLKGNQTQASFSGQFIVMPNNGYGGNVGIGTTSPDTRLVVGNITSQSTLKISGSSTVNQAPVLSLFRYAARESVMAQTDQGFVIANTGGLANYNDTTIDAVANLTINNGGNVGIGTTAPGHKLEVSGDAFIGTQAYTDIQAGLIVSKPSAGSPATRIDVIGDNNYQDLQFIKTDYITGTGVNWGFGQRNDTYFGNTAGSFQIVGARYIGGVAQSTYNVPLIAQPNGDLILEGGTANVNNGKVGIGTTGPTALLDVAGTASVGGVLKFRSGTAQIQATADQTLTLGGDSTGNITLSPFNSAVGASVTPGITNQVDLGTAALQWRNIYGQNIYSNGVLLTNGGYWQRNAGNLSPVTLNDTVSATSSAFTVATFTTNNAAGTLTNNTLIQQTGAGTVTNLLNLTQSAGAATNAIDINGTFTNLINSPTLVVNNAGAASGLTGLASSGTITFSGLTASQAVFTDGSKNLVSNAITGSGNVVMSTSPALTTSLTTGSTSFDLLNTTATTVNFAGGATTTLKLGSSTANTVNVPSLTASSVVYTDSSKNLTSTAPTTGTIGYWSRAASNLYPATTNDTISATSSAFTVATFTTNNAAGTLTNNTLIQQTGAGTVTNLLNLTQSAGAATNGITFTGTFTKLINSTNFNVTNAGAVTAVGVNSGTGLLQGTGGLTLTGTTSINDSASTNTTSIGGGTTTGQITIGGTGTQTLAIGNGAGAKTVQLGSNNGASTTTILSGSGNLTINNNAGTTTTSIGTGTTTGAIAIGGGSDTLAINTSNWDITSAGVASGLTGLSSSGTITLSGLGASAFVVTDASKNLTTAAGAATSAELISILSDETGSGVAVFGTSPAITTSLTTGSTSFDLLNTTATTVNFAGAATTLNLGAPTGNASISATLTLGGSTSSTIRPGTGALNFGYKSGANAWGTAMTILDNTGSVGIGTINPLATLDIRGNSGTIPIASISGRTSFAALVVDNSGVGDLIVASSSAIGNNPARTQFQVTNTGAVYGRLFGDLDATSYFLDPAATAISLAVAGSVGIGTTTPVTKLEVDVSDATQYSTTALSNGATASDGLFIVNTNNSAGTFAGINLQNRTSGVANARIAVIGDNTTASALTFLLRPSSGTATAQEMMRITSNGNVGIGVTGPGNKLTIATAGFDDAIPALGANGGKLGLFRTDSNNGSYGMLMGELGSGNGFIQVQRVDGSAAAYSLLLNPNGGNVGIGQTSPGALLHIGNGSGSDYGLEIQTPTGWNTHFGWGGNNYISTGNGSSYSTFFRSTGGTWMTVRGDGNVGIGTTIPGYKLDIAGTTNISTGSVYAINGASVLSSSTLGSGVTASSLTSVGTLTSLQVTGAINNNGAIGVMNVQNNINAVGSGQSQAQMSITGSTTDSGYPSNTQYGLVITPTMNGSYGTGTGIGLYVAPTFNTGQAPGFGAKWAAYFVGSGYLSAAAWTYGSDIRLKENISSVNTGLDKIMQLRPVKFDYINGDKNNLGFIAQQVQAVIPEAVSISDPATGMLGLKTDFIIPYLVKAIQEQQGEIASLSAKLDTVVLTNTGDLNLVDQTAAEIGNTNPGEQLSVGNGTVNSSFSVGTSTGNKMYFTTYSDTAYMSINRRSNDGAFANTGLGASSIGFISDSTGGYLDFNTARNANTNPSLRMRIDENGNTRIYGSTLSTTGTGVIPQWSLTAIVYGYWKAGDRLVVTVTLTDNGGQAWTAYGYGPGGSVYLENNSYSGASRTFTYTVGGGGLDYFGLSPGNNTNSNTNVTVTVSNGYLQVAQGTYSGGNIQNYAPSQGYLELSGDLSGYPINTYPTLKTNGNTIHFDAAGTYTGYISYNSGFTDVSDEKLKTNIVNIDDALNKVLQINGVDFAWKDGRDNFQKHIGVIAQNVQKVAPELVTDDGTGTLGVFYGGLGALAIEAIKELNVKVDTNYASLSAGLAGVALTPTGDLSLVDQNVADTGFTIPHYFTLNDALGNPISKVGAFAEVVVANLRAGLINAQQITTTALSVTTENITINGQNIKDYIAGIVQGIINNTNNNVISPIASVDQLHTNFISPLGDNSQIGLKLDKDKLSILNTNSASGSAVASIDNQGNASFSGQLTSNSLSTNNASISGTLHAGKIIADQIEGLNIQTSTISAQYITNVTNVYNSTPSSFFPTLAASPAGTSTDSGIFNNLFASNNFINIASYSSQLAYVENLGAANAMFSQSLMVFGPTSLSDTSIVGQLSVNGSLILASNSINVLGSDLSLQPLRQGGLSIMAGLFHIDTDGNLQVGGNAEFAKDVTIKGTLAAGVISPLPGNNLNINLGNGQQFASGSGMPSSEFRIQNSSSSSVLSINSLGDLIASGAGTFAKLNLNLAGPAFAVSPTEIIATGSAGIASITPYKTQVTIDNVLVTDRSLIYITPTSSTNNQVLYLLRQVPGQSFTVGLQNPSVSPIPFNWIIVN